MAERKSHIIRIKGKQKVEGGDPETLDDVWADVRRTDELPLDDTGDGQERVLLVAWDDDFTGDPPEDEDRIERIVKLTDPENPPDDPDNPDVYIPIPALDQFAVFDADQKIIISLANKVDDGDETLREVRVKRITHADTDPAELDQPIDAADYRRVPDTEDEGQYIDHEVIESSPHFDADQEHRLLYGADDDDLINSFASTPEDRPQPPVRLDLLQNIVNVQWGGAILVLFWARADLSYSDLSGKAEHLLTLEGNPYPVLGVPSPGGLGDWQRAHVGPPYHFLAFKVHLGSAGDLVTLSASVAIDISWGTFDPDTFEMLETLEATGLQTRGFCYVLAWKKDYEEDGFIENLILTQLDPALHVNDDVSYDYRFFSGALLYLEWLIVDGQESKWQAGNIKHRDDGETVPPDKMIQVYPISGPGEIDDPTPDFETTGDPPTLHPIFGSPAHYECRGYFIHSYRLDKKGTDTVYDGVGGEWGTGIVYILNGDPSSGINYGPVPLVATGNDFPLEP